MTTDEIIHELGTSHMSIRGGLIKFANFHREEALKSASEKAISKGTYRTNEGHLENGGIDKQSILSAYPIDNIK